MVWYFYDLKMVMRYFDLKRAICTLEMAMRHFEEDGVVLLRRLSVHKAMWYFEEDGVVFLRRLSVHKAMWYFEKGHAVL